MVLYRQENDHKEDAEEPLEQQMFPAVCHFGLWKYIDAAVLNREKHSVDCEKSQAHQYFEDVCTLSCSQILRIVTLFWLC